MNRQRFLRALFPVLIWMAVIFSLSTHAGSATHTDSFLNHFLARFLPGLWRRLTWAEIDGLHYYVRKAAHVTEYAILGILMIRAFRAARAVLTRRLVFTAWVVCAFYAATDEFHQVFVSGRTPKVTDVLLDAAGAAFGMALYHWFTNRRTGLHSRARLESSFLEDPL